MGIEKSILGIIPGLQATSLVAHNLKLSKMNKMRHKPLKPNFKNMNKNIIKGGISTIAGVALIKPTSAIINNL